jgi:acyl-coenzyme A synthetase/AMP-(fatty) acid ligase
MHIDQELTRRSVFSTGFLHTTSGRIAMEDLALTAIPTSFLTGERREEWRGRIVLLATRDPMELVSCLLRLDGIASRLILCPTGLTSEHVSSVMRDGEVDACIGREIRWNSAIPTSRDREAGDYPCQPDDLSGENRTRTTEWVLPTSATTGTPKLVQHTLRSLTYAFADDARGDQPVVWSTFYDIQRYGGIQILLRGLFNGAIVLSSPDETMSDFLRRASQCGITHISGTPSHWRQALISGAARLISPRYVRLSGEIADQAILDALHVVYPESQIVHAFATTEAGVAFEIDDGLAGFPEDLLKAPARGVELKIEQGTLRVRSPGNAQRYLGDAAPPLHGPDGFVDTGDFVELCNGRYHFKGRSGGIINVGGLKVHPEEVESVINRHPRVRQSLVKARRSPITGSIVSAEVVLLDRESSDLARTPGAVDAMAQDIIEHCRRSLAAYKVPAIVHIVDAVEVSPAGKLVRRDA